MHRNTKQTTMRALLGIIALLGALALCGCGSSPSQTPDASGQQTQSTNAGAQSQIEKSKRLDEQQK